MAPIVMLKPGAVLYKGIALHLALAILAGGPLRVHAPTGAFWFDEDPALCAQHGASPGRAGCAVLEFEVVAAAQAERHTKPGNPRAVALRDPAALRPRALLWVEARPGHRGVPPYPRASPAELASWATLYWGPLGTDPDAAPSLGAGPARIRTESERDALLLLDSLTRTARSQS